MTFSDMLGCTVHFLLFMGNQADWLPTDLVLDDYHQGRTVVCCAAHVLSKNNPWVLVSVNKLPRHQRSVSSTLNSSQNPR